MRKSYPDREKLFTKIQQGDSGALFDLLEAERHRLFDFLLRMNGQVSRSVEATDEVFISLNGDTLAALSEYGELKTVLYASARKLNTDIWNAETSRLVNAALNTTHSNAPAGELPQIADLRAATLIDKLMRGLAGPQREAALLFGVEAFAVDEIAEIMELSAEQAEALVGEGMRQIEAEVGGPAEAALQHVVPHPMPIRSSHMTVNLSTVMQGIKTKHSVWTKTRIAVFALIIGGAAYFYLHPEVVSNALTMWRSLPRNR